MVKTYRIRIWLNDTSFDGEPDEVVEVEEGMNHIWKTDPHYSSSSMGIDIHPDDCPGELKIFTSESVRAPPEYDSHVEKGYWNGPVERGLDFSEEYKGYTPFGCELWGRVLFRVE